MPNATTASLRFNRLLLTGANGNLGRELRPRLKAHCETLRLSHRSDMGPAGAGEEICIADLADAQAVHEMLRGVDAVVHMGGVATEQGFEPILAGNIVGMHNLYEGARLQGVKRIIFASSNHVTGFYRQDEVIDPRAPVRPDGLYGVSKVFGEALSRMYFDKFGIETVCLRIGSCYEQPRDRRMLATWLSFDDLERLIVASLTAPIVGHSVIYGMSDNQAAWWDNRPAQHIGYRPKDSADDFRAAVEAQQPVLDLNDPAVRNQGGGFSRPESHVQSE